MQLQSLKLCKSVLPKDIKMPTATLAYPQYTHQQMRWRGLIPGTSCRYLLTFCQELHALARTATADCSRCQASKTRPSSVRSYISGRIFKSKNIEKITSSSKLCMLTIFPLSYRHSPNLSKNASESSLHLDKLVYSYVRVSFSL